jgi:hypothetical protein
MPVGGIVLSTVPSRQDTCIYLDMAPFTFLLTVIDIFSSMPGVEEME